MDPRAFIGYLVGYESTNLFCIWVPQRRRVIVTQDVTFNEDSIYNPGERQLPLAQEVIEIIENPLLNQEEEPTAQVETPFLYQDVELPPKETNFSRLLTQPTDTTSRFTTLEGSGQPTDEGTPSRNN